MWPHRLTNFTQKLQRCQQYSQALFLARQWTGQQDITGSVLYSVNPSASPGVNQD